MQSVSSRIWTRVTVPISYDDNHYTTGTYSAAHYTALVDWVYEIKQYFDIGINPASVHRTLIKFSG